MKKLMLALVVLALPTLPVFAEDTRQLAKLTPEARETLRQEMFDNLLALNNILTLLAANQVKEAGAVAEMELGRGAMGKNRHLPFEARPGPQMPRDMHQLAIAGHFAASDFATLAASGDREKALSALPAVTGTCIACHASYRTR